MSKSKDVGKIIEELLVQRQELRLGDIADAANLSLLNEADRKLIRRAIYSLVDKGVLQAKGASRARVYVKISSPQISAVPELSKKENGNQSNSIRARAGMQMPQPVSYNQDFLRAYKPNKTYYLDFAQRKLLMETGKVESVVRAAGTYARNIMSRLLIDLSWNSSRLEGNTYSLLETKRLIELGESAQGKHVIETQMILNHKGAIEFIVESIGEENVSANTVMSIHALLSENLLGDPAASGRLRSIAVGIRGSAYIPLENPHILKECFDLFIESFNQIKDPFEQSFFSLVHLSYLQAFEDVNKRTARLVANIPLIKYNLKPLSFTDVDSDSYVKSLLALYENGDVDPIRQLYIWAYQRSSQKYSAIQQAMGEPNLLKLRFRDSIHGIVRSIILELVRGKQVVPEIRKRLMDLQLTDDEREQLFTAIETEILSLHEGNVARFKVRPSEFMEWKSLQNS